MAAKTLIINLNLALDKTVYVPRLRPHETYRLGPGVITLPGGKGVNMARALRSAGGSPVVAGFVAGHMGSLITKALEEAGLRSRLFRHGGGESRLCFTLATSGGTAYNFNEEGAPVPLRAQRAFLAWTERASRGAVLAAVCGRRVRGLAKEFYRELSRRLLAGGAREVGYDASGPALRDGALGGATLVKINRREFMEFERSRFSAAAVARCLARWRPRGLRTLIVTNSSGPGYCSCPSGNFSFTPPAAGGIVNPVGAGDSFMAGWARALELRLGAEASLKLAAGCSVADCMTLGSGVIARAEAERWARRVRVKKI
ncbi:MAG: tagatose 6-phosphate kinase [Elusimicrobia bacterium]|nr:MAG: tagatose 6-phosphate kinase [Elusimicrobiota bacterium]KAF0154945.1 MAG: tagatose 6-phosphate kinase [Elusimicrobiota bacterium]